MFLADHPLLFQHPWTWLVTGQNAAGVQALAAVVATSAAIGAAGFAALAYRDQHRQLQLTREQTSAAKEQVNFAREQTILAREQVIEERKRLEEEREQMAKAKQRALQLRIAEEESLRPRLSIFSTSGTGSYNAIVTIKNSGEGSATFVEVFRPAKSERLALRTHCPVNDSFIVQAGSWFQREGLEIHFQTQFGTTWHTLHRLGQPEKVLKTVRVEPVL